MQHDNSVRIVRELDRMEAKEIYNLFDGMNLQPYRHEDAVQEYAEYYEHNGKKYIIWFKLSGFGGAEIE